MAPSLLDILRVHDMRTIGQGGKVLGAELRDLQFESHRML